MGIPIVTLRNKRNYRFASRMGETLLTNIGLGECVTDNEDAYIAKAISLAVDLTRLDEMHNALRSQLLNSPVCDGAGFTRDLEAAFRDMWETWCHSRT